MKPSKVAPKAMRKAGGKPVNEKMAATGSVIRGEGTKAKKAKGKC